MKDMKKKAYKEVIEKLLVKVEIQEEVITKLICCIGDQIGHRAVNILLAKLRQQGEQK